MLARISVFETLIVIAYVWGVRTISITDKNEHEGIALRVAIVQRDIDQRRVFQSYSGDDEERMAARQTRIASHVLGLLKRVPSESVDLVVTPETAFTQTFFDIDLDLLASIQAAEDRIGAPLVTRATNVVVAASDNSYVEYSHEAERVNGLFQYRMYNGLFVFRQGDEARQLRANYRKIHLVPFAETVPGMEHFPSIRRIIAPVTMTLPGKPEQRPIRLETVVGKRHFGYRFGPSICFENKFACLQNRMARRGAQVLINISNNAWFSGSSGIDFLFHGARTRPVETRIPMILCSNSGETALLGGAGRVVDQLPRDTESILFGSLSVPRNPSPTLYARFGDWFGILAFAGSLVILLVIRLRRRLPTGGEFTFQPHQQPIALPSRRGADRASGS